MSTAPKAFGYRLQPVTPGHVAALYLTESPLLTRARKPDLTDLLFAARVLSTPGTEDDIKALRLGWRERWAFLRCLLSKKYVLDNTLALLAYTRSELKGPITIVEEKDVDDG